MMIDISNYIKILNVIGKKNDEWEVIVSSSGEIVSTYKLDAINRTTNIALPDNTFNYVKLVNHSDVFIGNILVTQPFTLKELLIAMNQNYKLNIIIDGNYIYILKVGKSYTNDYICNLYNTLSTEIKEEWRFNVIRYNLSLYDYITNVNHAIVNQLCKKLGWYYHRQLHGFYKKQTVSIVIPPCELPSFIFQSEEGWVYAKKHIERWKKLIALYPELRKFNFDIAERDYIPMLSNRKLNLDAI